ncbi:MAG: nucleotide exchange factor GrpE [Streptosporangiaceae bacterium]
MMPDNESQGPVIRDRRRIDPATGEVRETGQPGPQRGPGPAGGQPKPGKHSVSKPGGAGTGTGSDQGGATASGPLASGPDQMGVKLAERTADLQRLQAEYANYRKRVERDRLAVREQALTNVLHGLLPVLDDIGRAREHGELTGGFKSVAESLEGIVVKLGLTAYGENGDPFDPMLHEALMHSYSADVTEPTCVQILQPGYRVGERIIRPARVAVAEPGEELADEAADPDSASAEPAGPGSVSPDSASTQSSSADSAGPDSADPESASAAQASAGAPGAEAAEAAGAGEPGQAGPDDAGD